MICVSIAGRSFEDCLKIRETEGFLEFRLDLLDFNPDQVDRLFRHPSKMIATCREGKYDQGTRERLIRTAIRAGADYVDIELDADPGYMKRLTGLARKHGTALIISHHDFAGTPPVPGLRDFLEQCYRKGADIAKLSCFVRNREDISRLLSIFAEPGEKVVIGMGEMGGIVRLACPLAGGAFTFASPDDGIHTASGQLKKSKMEQIYRLLKF